MFNLDNLTDDELDQLRILLQKKENEKRLKNNLKLIKENQKYIGKCFKEKKSDKFIRVLSSKSCNTSNFECMCFEFPINVEEFNHLSGIHDYDSVFSTIDFVGIYVEDYPLLCREDFSEDLVIDNLIEITEKEYFDKMNEFVALLQEKIKNDEFNTSKNLDF